MATTEAARVQLEAKLLQLTGLQLVSLQDVMAATQGFSASCQVGGGGFGPVFRCTLTLRAGAREVAVKRLAVDSLQGEREWENEVKLLSQLQGHRNVVSILGFASEQGQHCILTPFLRRGSLQQALDTDRKGQLAFSALDRLGACLDVVSGLACLHAQRIWHLDLKRQ